MVKYMTKTKQSSIHHVKSGAKGKSERRHLFQIFRDPHQSRGRHLSCWNNTEGVKEGPLLLDHINEDLMVPTKRGNIR